MFENTRLTVDEFADALAKGMGRAFLHIRDHGDAGVEEALLDACLNARGYDPQCEGNRAAWLMSMIDLTPDPKRYYQAVMAALLEEEGHWSIVQKARIVAVLSQRGWPGARELLYAKFARRDMSDPGFVGNELVAIDGVDGLLHVARIVGQELRADPDDWQDNSFINHDCEAIGAVRAAEALVTAAQSDADIRAYIDSVIATSGALLYSDMPEKPDSRPVGVFSLKDFLAEYDKLPPKSRGALRSLAIRFGRRGNPEDLAGLIDLIDVETDTVRLLFFITVFRRVALPRLSQRLMTLAVGEDRELAKAALEALGKCKDPSIRQMALEQIARGRPEAIAALASSYLEGDFAPLKSNLHTSDIDERHQICMRVLDIWETQEGLADLSGLLWVYEMTPCGVCRRSAVRELKARAVLPEEIRLECLQDAEEETRQEAAASELLN